MYKVFSTEIFKENIYRWPKNYLRQVNRIIYKIIETPFLGKPLNYRFFREKKIKEKRIYFLVYDDLNLILLVAAGGKKDQQAIIDYIKNNLKQFRELAEILSKQS